MNSESNDSKLTPKTFIESMIRVGLIAILVIACVEVFSPFISVMIWGLIMSIMIYPLHQRIAKRLGGKQGLASTLIVLIGLLLIGTPLFFLGSSFATNIHEMEASIQQDGLTIKPPDAKVADWPIIGERAYKAWDQAATNLPQFVQDHTVQLEKIWQGIVAAAKNAIGSILLILGAFIISGIMMAFGKQGSNALLNVATRIIGLAHGPGLHSLTVATVRSVATGVLGVAFFQALLFGIGFFIAQIPAPGLLALIVMFIGIIQLPAAIVAIPVIIFLWASGGDASVTTNILLTVYFIFAGLSDNILKPLLLGRGVDAPMPVILIGAIGGLIAGGFLGLFIGSILLAVGYRIFMGWVNEGNVAPDTSEQAELAEATPNE